VAGIRCPARHQGYINTFILIPPLPRLGDQPILEFYDSTGAVIWSTPPGRIQILFRLDDAKRARF
jgi:hypothetical protein